MCGQIGIAGTIEAKALKVFHDMLIFNTVRGRDSTGVAGVDRDTGRIPKDTHLFKLPGPASQLQEFKRYDDVARLGKSVIMGHGRAATVGKINRANSHPFEFDNVIGTHNGTISWADKKALKYHERYDTDSEALYAQLSEEGVQPVITSLEGGAWSLCWYDKTDHSMNFLRNKERPLVFGLINDNKTLIWASEAWMIHSACGRNGIETEGKLFYSQENMWMKFAIPDKFGDAFGDSVDVEVKQKEAAPKPVTGNFSMGAAGYQHGQQQRAVGGLGDGKAASVLLRSDVSPPQPASIITKDKYKHNRKVGEIKYLKGWDGKQLDQATFQKLTGSTCAYSDEVVIWEDIMDGSAEITFIGPNRFVMKDWDDVHFHNWYAAGGK